MDQLDRELPQDVSTWVKIGATGKDEVVNSVVARRGIYALLMSKAKAFLCDCPCEESCRRWEAWLTLKISEICMLIKILHRLVKMLCYAEGVRIE